MVIGHSSAFLSMEDCLTITTLQPNSARHKMEFVDETRKVIYEAATLDSGLDEVDPDIESPVLSDQSLLQGFSQSSISETPNGQENPRRFPSRQQTLPESPRLSETASEALSPHGSVQLAETVSSSEGHARECSPTDRFIARAGTYHQLYYSKNSAFPIEDPVEAELYRHYVQSLAPWLDLCDPLRSFETIVPQNAANFPLLLKAIYSFSARHKTLTGYFDSVRCSEYYDECLTELRDVLAAYDESGADENLFAATIILRVLEEIDVVDNGTDQEANLLGIHAFVSTGSFFENPSPLSIASFWVGLRQGIYKAVINKRPVGLSVDHILVEQSLARTDCHSVANNAVVHCTRVLNFCFDKGGVCNLEEWNKLWKSNEDWENEHASFHTPIFKAPDDVPFPQIWYHQSCQVIGVQHHLLAKSYLIRFRHKFSATGTRHQSTLAKRRAEEINGLLRACSQPAWPSPLVSFCRLSSAVCSSLTHHPTVGASFTQRKDQEAMIDILRKTEKDHARPTKSVQEDMMKAWGWSASTWTPTQVPPWPDTTQYATNLNMNDSMGYQQA
uniref:Related to ARCA protein n=1 Tax=Neurospora crassa TaxID=5141 RepID=Q8X0P8_NEUCS|nr:related to ARCA protein [Neurospora crassa]